MPDFCGGDEIGARLAGVGVDAPGKFKLDQGEPSWRETHALLVGRRTIDRGDNTGVPATEQRGFGFPRQKDGNGDGVLDIDIGAFER